MLQQTQVVTVIPYFERFVARFPTIEALAAADEAFVLRLWEGLGYYRRARALHQAAKIIVTAHQGCFPTDPEVALSLTGIGRYTMGAILSQAFDRRLPILEANSRRVLCRWSGQRGNPKSAAVDKWLWQLAEVVLPKKHIGEFNQAIMELGALVCTPVAPACARCPIAKNCAARILGITEEIPRRTRPPATIKAQETAVLLCEADRVFLVQRPDHGRWAGLWEFPHAPTQSNESVQEGARRIMLDLTGFTVVPGKEGSTIRHSVTHHQISLTCIRARRKSGKFHSNFYKCGEWVAISDLPQYPLSAPQRRLARTLQLRRNRF